MDLVSGIKEAIKLKGSSVVTAPYFIGILEDFQAFAEEGINTFAAPKILKAICADASVQQIISTKNPRKHLGFGIKNAISNIGNQYGYDQDIIADILKKLLIGTGIISDTKEWDNIVGIQPTKSMTKSVNVQPKAGIKKNKKGKTTISRNRKLTAKIIAYTVISLVIIVIGVSVTIRSLHKSIDKDTVITLDFEQKIEVPYSNERITIPVSSNARNIKTIYTSDWCKVKVQRKKNIIIKCDQNKSGQARSANIVIDANGLKKDLFITQACKPVVSKLKIKNISCDFYAMKDSQRGLEVQYTINSSGHSNKELQSVITFSSYQSRKDAVPLPAQDKDYADNGQCAIIQGLTINDGSNTIKAFIPYSAMPELPEQSDNILMKLHITEFAFEIKINIYDIDCQKSVCEYKKRIGFQGLADHRRVYN